MFVLVVDDERTLNLPGEVTHVRTKQDAMLYLASAMPNEIWLDHDLGNDGEIMPLVNWLEEGFHFGITPRPDRIVVHSANPTAFGKISLALSKFVPVVKATVSG